MTGQEDLECVKEAMRSGRGSGRAVKRARRIERLRAKRAETRQVKMERRQQVKVSFHVAHPYFRWEELQVQLLAAAVLPGSKSTRVGNLFSSLYLNGNRSSIMVFLTGTEGVEKIPLWK